MQKPTSCISQPSEKIRKTKTHMFETVLIEKLQLILPLVALLKKKSAISYGFTKPNTVGVFLWLQKFKTKIIDGKFDSILILPVLKK